MHAHALFESYAPMAYIGDARPRPAVYDVVALKEYARGTLFLMPLSPVVSVGVKVPPSGVVVPSLTDLPVGMKAFISPKVVLPD
eukprot:9497253-Pyramimonas_sp.AAC.1